MPPIKTSAARAVPKTILEEGGLGRLLHGWCNLTLLAAVRVPEIDAGACFFEHSAPRCHRIEEKLKFPELPLRRKKMTGVAGKVNELEAALQAVENHSFESTATTRSMPS